MQNLLFVLALAGILLGGYSLFLPALRKRGFSLPLMHLIDDEDEDDVVGDDLDQPFDKAMAAKKAKPEKQPRAEKQPKPKKVKRSKGADSLVAEGFSVPRGLEMAPLPTKSARRPQPEDELEEIDPRIVIERPNADLDPDAEIELDPELQALLDSVVEDEVAPEAAGAAAVPAAAPVAVAETPKAEEKPKDGGDDFLSLFDDDTVEDTKPAALRDAIELCTIDELREEAAAMRAILEGTQPGQRAA